jgi:type IV pilus assembly protein PilY1
MKPLRKALCVALALSAIWLPVRQASAEDIDLFVGATGAGLNPNILIIIDNSANWSAASQHWPGGVKQGQSELKALRTVVNDVRPADSTSSRLNLGLMMFTAGSGSDISGGYLRFHVRPMTQAYVDALRAIIGDETCTDGDYSVPALPSGSVVLIPKCIYKNFDNSFEKTATANTDYSAALFEAFKYFGGYTDVAHAQSDPAVAGVPPTGVVAPHTFGVTRRSGTISATQTSAEYKKFDAAAYTDADKSTYVSPIGATNSCAKNYIILIGNGFPSSEPTAWDTELLFNVNQSSTQLTMPQFTTASNTITSTIGTACGNGGNAGQRVTSCLANSAALQAANPADSYTCINPRLENTAPCNGNNNFLHDVQSSKLVITVTPTGTFATPTSAKTRYADEWAKFLATTDVSSAGGQQTVSTYAIDVFKDAQDADQTALLSSMARYGAGKYFQATSEEAIISALRNILIEIQSVNTVFASASLPINATNRSQNENQVFIGMFRPDGGGRPRWFGNLKRYQIALIGGSAVLADADGVAAVGPSGFVAPCARSFWTSDTGNYWNFTQAGVTSFAGLCTTAGFSLFSDKPDGSQVEKGAVAEVLRRGNNPPTDTPFTYADANLPNASTIVTPTPAAVNRTLLTCQNTNTTTTFDNSLITCNTGSTAMHALNNTNIAGKDALGSGVVDNTERDRIINFTGGVDFANDQADVNQNTLTTDVRPDVHGDVAHSRPLPVNYGGTTNVVLYYGANDGTLRAVRGSDGKELWAFIAPEHHARLKRMRDNEPRIKYPGSTDASQRPKDYFFDGSAGVFQTFNTDNTTNTVWLFPSMRRGGRMLYGFNVTDPTAPRMLWRVGCPLNASDTGCTTGFTGIGQTWSIPAVAKIKAYPTLGSETPVIIVGGGYDSCEDNDAAATTCSTPKGRNVYVLNASTGAIIKTFGAGGTGTIDRSVAADITLVDLSFEGFAQHAYVVDTGGNLYRIDFRNRTTSTDLAPADWTITKIARTNVTDAARKFLFAPAALPSAGKVFLTFGSGDRERPLITNYPYTTTGVPTSGQLGIQNRFYMFVDTFPTEIVPPATVPTPTAAVNLDGSTMDDFTSGTSCSSALSVGSNGWRIDLNSGRGEQTVTSSTIFGGLVFFSTNRPLAASVASCTNNLGEARGYAINLLNASGAVGTTALCGGSRSNTFLGGGLPPSPVTGTVPVDGKPVTVMIGGIDRSGGASSPIGSQKVTPSITQKRSRVYWYRQGDQ